MTSGADWVAIRSVTGGWKVSCRLCGKTFCRTFMAANTNYAEASAASERYADEHRQSAPHAAALAAFHDTTPIEPHPSEALIAEVFGQPAPTRNELRRRNAKAAAVRSAR